MGETDLGVLVSSDGGEGSLRKDEGLEDAPANTEQVVGLDNVEPRVIAVHGMQNDLEETGLTTFNGRINNHSLNSNASVISQEERVCSA